MQTFLMTFGLFGLVMLAMAIGVLLQGKTLRGSCGGSDQSCFCEENNLPRACERGGAPEAWGGHPDDMAHPAEEEPIQV